MSFLAACKVCGSVNGHSSTCELALARERIKELEQKLRFEGFRVIFTLPECGLLYHILTEQLERDHDEHRPATQVLLDKIKKATAL